jgi:hypothetical protein
MTTSTVPIAGALRINGKRVARFYPASWSNDQNLWMSLGEAA